MFVYTRERERERGGGLVVVSDGWEFVWIYYITLGLSITPFILCFCTNMKCAITLHYWSFLSFSFMNITWWQI